MDEKPILISKTNLWSFMPFLLVVFILFTFLITFFTYSFYPLLLCIIPLSPLILTDKIYIYTNRLEIRFFPGITRRSIRLDEIENWSEIKKTKDTDTWKELTLYTKNSCYVISSQSYSNYSKLRIHLVSKKKKIRQRKISFSKTTSIALIILSLIASLFFFSESHKTYNKKNKEWTPNEIEKINGTIGNHVELTTNNHKRGYTISIEIHLIEYPNFTFQLNQATLSKTDITGILVNLKKADPVSLGIMKQDFLEKISQEGPLSFWQKNSVFSNIRIIEFSSQEKEYLTLKNYNLANHSDWVLPFLFFFTLGLTCLFFIIKIIKQ